MDYALANYREPQTQKPLGEAIALYTASKDHEFEQDQLSFPQLERIKRDLRRLLKVYPKLTVAELSAERLSEFCNLGKPSKKTYNNRRGSCRPSSNTPCTQAGWSPIPLRKSRIIAYQTERLHTESWINVLMVDK